MDLSNANAAIAFRGRVFAIAELAFDFHVSALLQNARPFRQLVPAENAMPFGAGPVLGAAFLFPVHARGQRKPRSNSGAVWRRTRLCVPSEKTDESNAILAKHVFVFLSCPICWGDPERRGPLSRQVKPVFRRFRSRLFAVWQKGAAGSLRGKPKPAGLELLSDGAERGNYPEAKPN
jgi:hypothetical protein